MKASFVAIAVSTATLAGCSSMTTREANILGGAAIGGVAGSALGGGTIGTVGGAAIGGLIGNEVGKEKERQERREYYDNRSRGDDRYYDNRRRY